MTLREARSLFDFQWARWRRERKQQKRAFDRFLEVTDEIDWHKMKRRLVDERITFKFSMKAPPHGGSYNPVTNTLVIRRDLAEWDRDKCAQVIVHEGIHAFDFLALDTQHRNAIFMTFHEYAPSSWFDPTAWGWPRMGLFPQHKGDDVEHRWFDPQYREGIGEAFAEACIPAFTPWFPDDYEHLPSDDVLAKLREIVINA